MQETKLTIWVQHDLLENAKRYALLHHHTEQALNLDCRAFEDAVQMVSALQSKVDCLITYNIKDYPATPLPVMRPVDFLRTL
jgi:hypothetical protein